MESVIMKHWMVGLMPIFGILVSCGSPLMDNLPGETALWHIEPVGVPRYVYLDDSYSHVGESTGAPGKILLAIEDNNLADGAMVIAETFSDEYDDAVRLINRKDGTVISMFFHNDQRFPWTIHVMAKGKQGNAALSLYDWTNERYSVNFEGDSGTFTLDLKREVLLREDSDPSLSLEQKTRLRNVYTALGIYDGISKCLGAEDIFLAAAEDVFASAFTGVAFAAFSATFNAVPPVFADSYSPAALSERGLFFGIIIDFIKGLFGGGGSSSSSSVTEASPPPPPAAPQPFSVTITKDGKAADLNARYYVERNKSVVFDISFENDSGSVGVSYAFYDPIERIYLHYEVSPQGHPHNISRNGDFFSYTKNNSPFDMWSPSCQLIVRRYDIDGTGYWDGDVDLVIFFGQNVVINGNSTGIQFHEPGTKEPGINNSIFVFRFTINPEEH
jgi:hypothetical protein